MKSNVSIKTAKMAHTAILTAIILALGLTPIGYLQLGVISMSFLTIPVVIGAMMLGPKIGALLGTFFGLTSFITCLGIAPVTDLFGVYLYSISPVSTFILCVVPRVLVGLFAGLIFSGLGKTKLKKDVSRITTAISGPLLNTLLFCSALILLFGNSAWSEGRGILGSIPYLFGLVWLNGLVEAIVCSIVIFAVIKALTHFNKRV